MALPRLNPRSAAAVQPHLRRRLRPRGLPPRALSVLLMTCSTGLHFAAYELARSGTVALFTSSATGFPGPSALPFAVGCVSPFSVLLLGGYARILERRGPRAALRATTIAFAAVLLGCAAVIRVFGRGGGEGVEPIARSWARAAVFVLFVYQNASVRLLHSQHWSYLGSVLTKKEAELWFSPITGIGSVTSTVAAGSIPYLLKMRGGGKAGAWAGDVAGGRGIGLLGLLGAAAIIMLVGAACSDAAYALASRHGFLPDREKEKEETGGGMEWRGGDLGEEMNSLKANDSDHGNGGGGDCDRDGGDRVAWKGEATPPRVSPSSSSLSVFAKARSLFRRVPTLGALFVEVLLCQSLSSLLSYLLMMTTKEAIPDDEERASWSGRCYAWTNAVSGVLQFLVIPALMRRVDPRWVWLFMPTIMAVLVLQQGLTSGPPSLTTVGASFFWMKVQEYSLRGVVAELVYVSLDFESRYLGKEVINLLADRLGKSGMAAALVVAPAVLGREGGDLQHILAKTAFGVAGVWFLASLRLVRVISSSSEPRGKVLTGAAT